jgi:hypothetical protein
LAAGTLTAQLGGDKPDKQDSPFSRDGSSGSKTIKVPRLPKKPADLPAEEDPDFVAARQLFWSGNYDQAEQLFATYLSKHPDHEPTKIFLRMIHEARHYDPEKEKVIRRALEEVRFKRVDWKNMSLDAAITFLRDETRRQIPEGEVVNFVNLVPASAGKKSITLSAEDTTLDQLIQRISEQAGVFHHVDSDGIVFETKARS